MKVVKPKTQKNVTPSTMRRFSCEVRDTSLKTKQKNKKKSFTKKYITPPSVELKFILNLKVVLDPSRRLVRPRAPTAVL